jgi:DNA-binding PucR family transcriptional regulator
LALAVDEVDEAVLADTLHVLLKYKSDIETAAKELATPTG